MEKEVDIVALDELLIDFTEDGDRTRFYIFIQDRESQFLLR